MCLIGCRDSKSRIPFTIANSSLAIGLLLQQFVHPSGQIAKDCLHAACGFLLGLSIAINLKLVLARRRRANCA
jgi:hypothetical protein